MQRPNATRGLRHVALYIQHFDACRYFYETLIGMQIDWQPDPDNVYLTSGYDNVALHRAPKDFSPAPHQHLDHIGFVLNSAADVTAWHDYLRQHGVTIKAAPKQHRDGTSSFYCTDPDGNTVQFIHIPALENK